MDAWEGSALAAGERPVWDASLAVNFCGRPMSYLVRWLCSFVLNCRPLCIRPCQPGSLRGRWIALSCRIEVPLPSRCGRGVSGETFAL